MAHVSVGHPVANLSPGFRSAFPSNMAVSRGGIAMSSLLKLRPVFSLVPLHLRKTVALYSSQDTSGPGSPDNTSTQENGGSGTTFSPERFPEGFNGAGLMAFGQEFSKVLMAPVNEEDIEIKPDGLIYLPEIKYRRILNQAFGPGGWALVPRGDSLQFQSDKDNSQLIVREYALFCFGRYVSQAAGEHTFYSSGNMVYGKAMEAAKSNALMRCCKDLGVASELWDPQFIIKWKEKYAVSTWCENVKTKEKKKMWRRKDRKPTDAFFYPWKEANANGK